MEGWKVGNMEWWKDGRFYHRGIEYTEKREWKNGMLEAGGFADSHAIGGIVNVE